MIFHWNLLSAALVACVVGLFSYLGNSNAQSVAQSDKCPPALTGEGKKSNDQLLRNGTAMISENNAGGYNNRGIAYTQLGKYDLALQDFDSERRLIGKNICGLCLPRVYLLKKQYDLAIKAIDDRRLTRASTGEDGLSCWRGMAYHQKGEYDLAIADYEKAMLNTDDFRSCGLYGRGFSRLKKGDVLGGKADMAAAVAADAKARFPAKYPDFFCYAGIATN